MNNLLIDDKGDKQLVKEDILRIEEIFKIKLPNDIEEFLLEYSDCFLKECFYEDNDIYVVPSYICGKSDLNPNIYKLIEGNNFYNYAGWLPLMIDTGGWVFNLSLKEDETKGQIWIDRFDSGEENPFAFVANSFEEFINGLQAEEIV